MMEPPRINWDKACYQVVTIGGPRRPNHGLIINSYVTLAKMPAEQTRRVSSTTGRLSWASKGPALKANREISATTQRLRGHFKLCPDFQYFRIGLHTRQRSMRSPASTAGAAAGTWVSSAERSRIVLTITNSLPYKALPGSMLRRVAERRE